MLPFVNSTDSVRVRRTGIQGGCHRRRKQQRSPEDIGIAYVYDGKIAYSPWTKGNSVTMKTPKEKEFSLDPAKLDFSRIASKK